MRKAERGEIDAAILMGGNLYASNPDSRWAQNAMEQIGTTVYLSTKLNEGHVRGGGQVRT